MSSVKFTRLFGRAGHASFEACLPHTPIHQALISEGLEALPLPARDYISPRTTRILRRWIRERDVKAVFLHSLRDVWLVAPALWGLDVKLFGFARMFLQGVSKKGPGHRLMYARMDALIALSHIQKRSLLSSLPVPEDKYLVIPNGVDVTRFQPRPRREDIRASWGIGPGQLVFGLIGRLDRLKGSLEFIEAAAAILKSHSHARFVLVGGNTAGADFDKEIRQRLTDLHLSADHVLLTDFRKDVPEVMNALDVFVMPSYEENFANVLLEALASGLPVIGTNSGGTPEILDNGQCGLLCEPRSTESLIAAMQTLIENPVQRQSLAQKARQKALREYDMNVIFQRVQSLVP